jgi:hypothetical protein
MAEAALAGLWTPMTFTVDVLGAATAKPSAVTGDSYLKK